MKSGRWEPVELEVWRGGSEQQTKAHGSKAAKRIAPTPAKGLEGGAEGGKKTRKGPQKGPEKAHGSPQEAKIGLEKGERRGVAGKAGFIVIKTERLPDGRTKVILKDKATGRVVEKIE